MISARAMAAMPTTESCRRTAIDLVILLLRMRWPLDLRGMITWEITGQSGYLTCRGAGAIRVGCRSRWWCSKIDIGQRHHGLVHAGASGGDGNLADGHRLQGVTLSATRPQ